MSKLLKKGYISMSEEVKTHIRAQIERTGFAPQRAIRGNMGAKRIGLNSGIIYSWLLRGVKSAKKEHVDLALVLWDNIPDKAILKEPKPKSQQSPKLAVYKSPSHGYQAISSEYLSKLLKEEARTGLSTEEILTMENIDIKSHVVRNWRAGKTKSADPKIMQAIVEGFAKHSSRT